MGLAALTSISFAAWLPSNLLPFFGSGFLTYQGGRILASFRGNCAMRSAGMPKGASSNAPTKSRIALARQAHFDNR